MKQILFNAEMVKSILDGRKTQTRRAVPFKIYTDEKGIISAYSDKKNMRSRKCTADSILLMSKYKIGDILWAREPVKLLKHSVDCDGEYFGTWIKYLADGKEILFNNFNALKVLGKKWFDKCQGVPNGCTKEMARIFLKVTNVRVERLQDISYKDIKSEGLCGKTISTAEMPKYVGYVCNAYDDYSEAEYLKAEWIKLWDSTAPKGYKWENNPYVFVYEFERVEKGSVI